MVDADAGGDRDRDDRGGRDCVSVAKSVVTEATALPSPPRSGAVRGFDGGGDGGGGKMDTRGKRGRDGRGEKTIGTLHVYTAVRVCTVCICM